MKTIRIIASTLVIACAASSAFAGPGIQYWQRKTTDVKATETASTETSGKTEKSESKSAKAKPALKKSAKAD